MAETQDTGSLFNTREVWETSPLVAAVELLKSSDYLQTGKPRAQPGGAGKAEPGPTKLGDGSITVYRAMLGKFLTATTKEHGCSSIFDLTERHIAKFFEDLAQADAKQETVNRYRRLLERVFDYLVSQGFIDINPVTLWLARFREQHENKTPESTMPASTPDVVEPETVQRLRKWLNGVGEAALSTGDWRVLRNVVAAMLSVGAGLRAKELELLSRQQLTIRPGAAEGQKVEITITQGATVRTAQAHRVMVDSLCEDLLLAWYDLRFKTGIRPTPRAHLVVPAGDRLFVGVGREHGKTAATASDALSVSYFNRVLKELAKQATDEGVLAEGQKWMLYRGAQGLRRAYTLVEIQDNAKPEDLRLKLGLHLGSSVRKYEQQIKAKLSAPRAKSRPLS